MPSGDLEIWLWDEIRYGNERALYQLYMSAYDSLFRYGLYASGDRTKAMDCINEVFTEIWTKRERLSEVKEVRSYLFVIYKRKLAHLIHRSHIVYSLTDDELLSASQEDGSYEDMLIAMQTEEERENLMRHALQKLTSRQKELVRMRYFEGIPTEEIADKLHLSLRTVYNTIHTALSILRKEVGGKK